VVWPIAVEEKAPGAKTAPAIDPLPWTKKAAAPTAQAAAQPAPSAAAAAPAVAPAPAEQPAPRPKPNFRHRSDEDLTWQERMLDPFR
jgi:hypothetical protein